MPELPILLYTREQVRELERVAIQELNFHDLELMSLAGYAVFQCLRSKWPNAKHIAIFCGVGNNAGDGYIIARLALQAGLSVTVYSVGASDALGGDALKAYQLCLQAYGNIEPFQPEQTVVADVIVDALFGIGLNKPVTGIMAQAVQLINSMNIPVIAVDIPSGIDADTGNVMGCAVQADCTVSFIGLKQGMFTGQSADYCGEIHYEALDLPDTVFDAVSTATYRVEKVRLPSRQRYSHKGYYGHVLVIGGERGYTGAIRLASEAALRVGAGLVSVATRPEHANLINVGRPELMCHGVENTVQLTPLLDKATIVIVGPGLGRSSWAKELFIAVINAGKPLIVDADGLSFLANARIKNAGWILTPHPGEAAQLLHCSTEDIEQDRFAAVSAIQDRYAGIAVLKGAGTLIASYQGIAVSNTGNPGMASGGMGDTLAGVIGGLLAQGLLPKDAAQQGVYLHGLAGDRAAEQHGERGLLASDLMPYLSQLVAL